MKTLTRRLPLVLFVLVSSGMFVGSYYSGIEYRRSPSGKTQGVVLKQDLADHAKLTASYSVNGASYELIETAILPKNGAKIDVYYLLSDPAHATFKNPEWIWYKEAGEIVLGVGLWCTLIYFALLLRSLFRDDKTKRRPEPNHAPQPTSLTRRG